MFSSYLLIFKKLIFTLNLTEKRNIVINEFSLLYDEFSLFCCKVELDDLDGENNVIIENTMLEELFAKAPTAMLLVDPKTNKILTSNEQATRLFSLANQKIDDVLFSSYFANCLGELTTFTQQILADGQAWTNQLSIMVNNTIFHLDINAKLLGDNILLSCQDSLVLFKQHFNSTQEANYKVGFANLNNTPTVFSEIERHNQLLLSAVGDGIYGVDTEGRATFVNKAAERILGWKSSEINGQKIHDIIHHSHIDGQSYHVHDCPIYAAFKDGAVHSVDNEVFWSKTGQPVPVEYTSTPVTENGILVGAVVIFRDITERKQTQEKLLTALAEVDALKQRLELEKAYLLEELNADFNYHQIIGQSEKVKHMINQISLVGPTNANVLIMGESGTGKELIARAIHQVSDRKHRPLIRVNCAAIPSELFESEFFGHVKGAFSGAINDRIGRFELADGATIFLDEVGEIPLSLQSKLLRVLQEQQFERVGDSKTRTVDVRVISATNQNLKNLVAENKFREDLYFRLNVFPIESPSLRERADDIPILVKHFIEKICKRINLPQPEVTIRQMNLLQKYSWPGNIRELENIVERQIILAKGNKLKFDFLANISEQQQSIDMTNQPELLNLQAQKALDKANLEAALKQAKGKIYGEDGAASLLGLKPTTLASKLKKYQINRLNYKS